MKLVDLSWPEIETLAPATVAVLPIAATEQHGPHLAVSADAAIVTAIAGRAETQLAKEIVLCPTLTVGSSHHHIAFPGTLSISPETYVQVLVDLIESLLNGGFRRIVLLNGHGGNAVPAKQALTVLSHRYDDTLQPNIAFASYWELAGSAFAGAPPLQSPALSHACEYETSMMLYLHSERVHMERIQSGERAASNAYVRWQLDRPGRGVTMVKGFHTLLNNGANGQPELANAEKGQHLIEAAVQATVEFLRDFSTWPLLTNLRETPHYEL